MAKGRPKAETCDEAFVIELACARCGGAFLEYRRNAAKHLRHFCSVKCRLASCDGNENGRWDGGLIRRLCLGCGTEFAVKRHKIVDGKGKYCSPKCGFVARRVYASTKDRLRANGLRRQIRERSTSADAGSHTPAQWDELKRRAKGRCVRCRRKRPLTRDHIIPLSKGGHNLISNIQPLCKSCNSSKRDRVETLL